MSPTNASRPGVDRPLRAIHVVVADMATLVRLVPLLVDLGRTTCVHGSTWAFLAAEASLEEGLVLCDARLPKPDVKELRVQLAKRKSRHEIALLPPLPAMDVHGAERGDREISIGGKLVAWDQRVKAIIRSHGGHDRSRRLEARMNRLSPREREVLQWIVAERSSNEIARELDISKRTVDHHRANIMQKLGVHTVAGVVALALRSGRYAEETL